MVMMPMQMAMRHSARLMIQHHMKFFLIWGATSTPTSPQAR